MKANSLARFKPIYWLAKRTTKCYNNFQVNFAIQCDRKPRMKDQKSE